MTEKTATKCPYCSNFTYEKISCSVCGAPLLTEDVHEKAILLSTFSKDFAEQQILMSSSSPLEVVDPQTDQTVVRKLSDRQLESMKRSTNENSNNLAKMDYEIMQLQKKIKKLETKNTEFILLIITIMVILGMLTFAVTQGL